MKKSIVLLITLALIVAISSLIYIGFELVDKSAKTVEGKHNFLQSVSMINDIKKILEQNKKDINSTDGLDLLFSMPIDLKAENITVHVEFSSAATGINPNNFVKTVNKKQLINSHYILLFDRILQNANVLNKELFLAMIEDTLDKDLEERFPGSEIALYDRRFAQGSIENFQKFQKIIEHYITLTQDGNINKIPWVKILGFFSKKIDFNYINPILLHYMLPFLDKEALQKLTTDKEGVFTKMKELHLSKEDKEELKKYDIAFYVPVIKVDLEIEERSNKSFAHFIYDLTTAKVKDIAIR
ncbi:hypothetical protein [Nitratiruptor tergarcus]|uniref:Uncharacterized protein n=1 Tax=Nitratiruptor tergarcus DSM 16512 TaxID=1069081 RepID=A0A1W1WVF1_9BACT|nr:hypothetical protein [Nitratiruptor tergarcus]SMC10185.1 hypothetical protein SAMN05660197_2027 [Nitratiruptor tergarcus DSM 16512]